MNNTNQDLVTELLAAEGITGTPERIAEFTAQLHEHLRALQIPSGAYANGSGGGEPAPVPQPDEQPQPIAA